jgi:hypothetical protein
MSEEFAMLVVVVLVDEDETSTDATHRKNEVQN